MPPRALSRLGAVAIALLALLGALAAAPGRGAEPARRVVSMNPSLTETLVALGAVSALVGVDDFSARQQPAVASLPTVGGLFNPSLEAVVALRPDLVVLVPSAEQRDFHRRLNQLGIEVLALSNITLDQLLDSILQLGARVGRTSQAREQVARIRASWQDAARARAGRRRPRGVLVIQREPLFVVGGSNFLNSMLDAVGVDNAAAILEEPYPRVAMEWLVAAAPELILDASDDPLVPAEYWARWPSLPAVVAGRAISIPQGEVTRPGPHLDRALRLLDRAVHGDDASAGAPP